MTRATHDSRSISPRGERSADDLDEGAAADVDASQGNVEAKCGMPNHNAGSADSRTAHHAGVTRGPTTFDELRAAPVTAHPLRVYLVERECTYERAAKIFGVSTRAIEKWIGWESRPSPRRAAEIARLLGFGEELDDDLVLFPHAPENDT